MKNLIIILILLSVGCTPSTRENATNLVIDQVTTCLSEVITADSSKEGLEQCITAVKGKLTQTVLVQLKGVLSGKFSSENLSKILNVFFGVPDGNSLQLADDRVKINLIVQKIEDLK